MKQADILVTREDELNELGACLSDAIAETKPVWVLVVGDYGMGKTTLLRHFVAQAGKVNRRLLIASGRCSMETTGSGLVPFEQALASLGRVPGAHRVGGKELVDFITEVAPAWLDVVSLGVVGAAMTTGKNVARLVRPAVTNQDLFSQYTNALSNLTRNRPALITIEDLHWADKSSLQLLFHIANNLHDRAVLFIATYRPVEGLELGPNTARLREVRANLIRQGGREIDLTEGIDVAQYARERYGSHRLPDSLLGKVQTGTEGHPFFVDLLFSWWEETGALKPRLRRDGTEEWQIDRGVAIALEIPDSAGVVLDERLRMLRPPLLEELIRASVQGDEFIAQIISEMLDLDEYQVAADLNGLGESYRLVSPHETRALGLKMLDIYRFAHRYYREHIYDSLNAGQKRVLHRRTGDSLEALCGESGPYAGQLARHFHEAHELAKAARYAMRAAKYEQTRYAWHEAEAWCRFALAIVDDLDKMGAADDAMCRLRLDTYELSAQGYRGLGDEYKASLVLKSALDTAIDAGEERERIARLYAVSADVADVMNENETAQDYLRRGLALFADEPDAHSEALLYLRMLEGQFYCWGSRDDAVRAVHILQDVLARIDERPPTALLTMVGGYAYNALGLALKFMDRFTESLVAFDKGIDLFRSVGDFGSASILLGNKTDVLVMQGLWDAAEQEAREAYELARRTGNRDAEAYSLYSQGIIALGLEQPAKAVPLLADAIRLSNLGHTGSFFFHADLALAHLALGKFDLARRSAEEALALQATDAGRAYSLRVLARTEAACGNWNEARSRFDEALHYTLEDGTGSYVAGCKRDYGRALAEQGLRDQATPMLTEALAIYQEAGLHHEAYAIQQLLADMARQ